MTLPTDDVIGKILADRVEALAGGEDGVGIVVGVVGPERHRAISYGRAGKGLRPFDGDTAFEIGSVTKVFTAFLLEEMVRTREVALTDSVQQYLPAGVMLPERNGRAITLLDLATHTSGLPFMPSERPTLNPSITPHEAEEHLIRFLAGYQLPRDIGSEWDYSNVGYWLLGQALASRAGTDFESLMRARVLVPLGMDHTAMTVGPKLRALLAIGHNAVLEPAPPWSAVSTYADMGAAGGLVSTANDLSILLSAAMGYQPSPLAPALAAMLKTRRPMPGGEQALGWVVEESGARELIVHEGGTLGFVSFIAWDPVMRAGVVVLSNQPAGVSDIGRHLLRPEVPLETPRATKRKEVHLEPAFLEAYAGRYEVPDEGVFLLAKTGDFLTIELPVDWGLPTLHLHPESGRDFFAAELPLRVTFQTADDGAVTGLLIYPPRGQRPLLAARSPRGEPPQP